MKNISRREWSKLTLQGMAAMALPFSSFANTPSIFSQKPNSKINGVQIGIQSYSLRDRSIDEAIQAIADLGINSCELWGGHLEPKGATGEERKKWRMTAPMEEFKNTRKKFDKAGIDISAYNYGFRDNQTDEEIERGFLMAKAMGVNTITSSATVSVAKRVDTFAKKHKIYVGMHNHDNLKDPNEYATPESFAKAMEGASKYMAINLDIGHFTAANFDAIDYMKKNHEKILMIHLKDRKKDHGANLPWGEGDTPIKQALQLIRENKYKFPANIEYEYKGDTLVELRKCMDYCRQVLA
jgi:sugar phosphate isomerase/epimerase